MALLQSSFYKFHITRILMQYQISDQDLTWALPWPSILIRDYTFHLLVETTPLLFFEIDHIAISSLCHPVWMDFSTCKSHKRYIPSSTHHFSNHNPCLEVPLDSYRVGYLLLRMLQMSMNLVIYSVLSLPLWDYLANL